MLDHIEDRCFIQVSPYSAIGFEKEGEVTVLIPKFNGTDTTTFISDLQDEDLSYTDWEWVNALGVQDIPSGKAKLTVYPVPTDKFVIITNIQLIATDVLFAQMNCWLDHEEPTDGQYGHGVKFTVRINGVPVVGLTNINFPTGGVYGYAGDDALLGSGWRHNYCAFNDRVLVTVPPGSFMTISMHRKSDPRAILGYAGAGTPKAPIGNTALLEHSIRIRGFRVDAGQAHTPNIIGLVKKMWKKNKLFTSFAGSQV